MLKPSECRSWTTRSNFFIDIFKYTYREIKKEAKFIKYQVRKMSEIFTGFKITGLYSLENIFKNVRLDSTPKTQLLPINFQF